ncbi:MAG: D-2-hydroxyglutarate dehydrogenase YdiJ [Vibrio sp.]
MPSRTPAEDNHHAQTPSTNHTDHTLPPVAFDAALTPLVKLYLDELQAQGFRGQVEHSYASRLSVATDNSVYQTLPQAVLLPKDTQDVQKLAKLASEHRFESIKFSPRGGGTGTNGQSLTNHIVVDLSRHMNQILEINEQEGWVRLQAGVIKDQLNDAVREAGFFFSPDLSTSNRATLGGMINTDASGQGSLQYGKTSDHVLSLQAVFSDGSCYETDGSQGHPVKGSVAQSAFNETYEVCHQYRDEILEKFPPLNRFLTGYDLKNAITDDGEFDFTRILCGAEGSLAFITEAKLNLTPLPKARVLVNLKFDSFDAALRSAPDMVTANALSVETIDSNVLNLAKQDIVWHSVRDLLTDVEGKTMLGINMVEFAGPDEALVHARVKALVSRLDAALDPNQSEQIQGFIGYQVCDDLASINKIYGMRKKAVGLLGASKTSRKPIPFAEDTCVPPENLADFITEFRALLDSHQLAYGMFGHVDAGVLHVRPALDLCDPKQEAMMHQISDQVVALVAKYGGLMWGEHGKGYRSEYGPEFFGESLFTQLRAIKTAFDPLNKMNPGKICTPLESHESLVKVSDTKRASYDRQIPIAVRESYPQAMNCNGNGLCFNYDTNSPMCPSMKITQDRRHSPKGRAGLMREWLRLLSNQSVDIIGLEEQVTQKGLSLKALLDRELLRFQSKKTPDEDYSHQVYESMNLCLACKTCASQCPIQVDVPAMRSRFLNLYHSRYPRPVKDYLVAKIETMLPWMGKAPKLVNAVIDNRVSASLTRKAVGYVDTPLLSTPTLKSRLKQAHLEFNMLHLQQLIPEAKSRHVLIVQDPFSSFYDAQVVADFIELAERLGKKPILLPFKPNGKAQHIKGFLNDFNKTAQGTAEFLNQVARLGIPMVGVDPAMVLCYRDEYKQQLGEEAVRFQVQNVHEWLISQQESFKAVSAKVTAQAKDQTPWYLFAHCTEKTKMANTESQWQHIFAQFGASLKPVAVGCCGMAGTFGHEADKLELSKGIYQLSWQQPMQTLPQERCLATGYSCRSQVKRFEAHSLKHPLQALLEVIA